MFIFWIHPYKVEKKLEKQNVKRRKIEREEKFSHITEALKQATPPYCKRWIPTLNHILWFLKKEKGVSESVLSTISIDSNVFFFYRWPYRPYREFPIGISLQGF